MSDAIKAEIKKLEDRRFQAMIDGDFDTLDKLLGDDLIYTHSSGAIRHPRRVHCVCARRASSNTSKIERPIENIQVYGDTVVVTGHTKMDVRSLRASPGCSTAATPMCGSTARRGGRWWCGSPRRSPHQRLDGVSGEEGCMEIDGRCHCGFLSYEGKADPEKVAICHCTDCQVLSGTAFRTAVWVAKEDFKLLSGEPTIYVKTTDRGTQTAQVFCPRCGSQIYATHIPEPKFYAVRLGTVRQRNQLLPKFQIWTRSQQPWLANLSEIRKVEEQ